MRYLDLAARATVTVTKKHGRGVLVNGNLILTAAHCITYSGEGQMALGDWYIEDIKAGKEKLKVAPVVVEPVTDIAVLGALDNQAFFKEVEEFEAFCEKTQAVPLRTEPYEARQPFGVYILNRNGKWTKGNATFWDENAACACIEPEEKIKPGASGGPILNEAGELVGIVSWSGEAGSLEGLAPFPFRALPVWIRDRIVREQMST
jgi:hypothetical protein